jgi:acetylornithine/succinyldiaminopimelate/putrescine aminotransferase/predicted amino acid dehydrogenase
VKFGFLAHATTQGQRNQVRAAELLGHLLTPPGAERPPGAPGPLTVPVPVFRSLTSATGARCTGEVRHLPYTAQQLLSHPQAARELVVAEVERLCDAGAELAGLGGATSIVGDRGRWTAAQVAIPVTSGNSLTTYAAYRALHEVVAALDLPVDATPVAVIGYPGSIGLALARLLLDDGFPLHLVHRRSARAGGRLLDYLDPAVRDRVTLHADPASCYPRARLFLAASSTGGLVDPSRLQPGSVVIDVALPRDVPAPPRGRDDLLVIDGGLVSARDGALTSDGPLPVPAQQLNGCLAETMVLAFESRAACWSLGRELDVAGVRAIGEAATRHGLEPTPLASFGVPLRRDDLPRLRRYHHRLHRRTGVAEPAPDAAAVTAGRFRRHLNPPLADFYAAHRIDHVFTSARGCTLTTADGTEYLDFVAGYGCLNLGHNHPVVVDQLRRFLDSAAPAFVQYVSMPVHTAELAERLCALAPGSMARAFFSNSGAEAVEAALKLARAATGRSRLVYVQNSYHGKTLGALSVTGRASHRQPFAPLLPECVAVPYGDLAALAGALEGAAAFIVEPVLGEGGVVLPPPGYLPAAQRLCRRAGAVFIVDEVQTGLGRTGAMFACDHERLEPDVLCLAKSLSGGLVPVAATLASAEVWDAGYGSADRSLLHTSTFGGGNLAAAAGLATLDVLVAEDLPAHARDLGEHLRRSLREACAPYSFVKEVRGVGLMNAIACDTDLTGAFGALAGELLTRMPGDLHALARWLPEEATAALRTAGRALESTLGDLLCLRLVTALARDHRILTFLTANSNRVLRIQPPLVLTRAQADRFTAAVAAACAGLAIPADLAARPSRPPRLSPPQPAPTGATIL